MSLETRGSEQLTASASVADAVFAEPILVFGGPYSNLEATEAVLRIAAGRGVTPDRIVCTGDVVAYGANPLETADFVRNSGIRVVMGNCEEALGFGASDCGCGYAKDSYCDALSAAWFAYADGRIDAKTREWMRGLPRRIDIRIGRFRLAVVHGAVDRINGFIFPSADEAEIRNQLALADCDGVIAGHCGIPFTRIVDRKIWHNAGVVGLPANDGTVRTWYSLIEPMGEALRIRSLELDYDHAAAAKKMRRANLPEGYAAAIGETGIWPSADILPPAELANRGRPLSFGTVSFSAEKFSHPEATITGAKRATVALKRLETLWFNTGTLCNLTCANCYIESSPRNDRLAYIGRDEALAFMVEAREEFPTTQEIGFTGGEPFMNPDLVSMIQDAIGLGFRVLVLTNAMKPMQFVRDRLQALNSVHPGRIAIRVSLDHHEQHRHEKIRGPRSWQAAIEGLRWLAENRFDLTVAARTIWGESEAAMRDGFRGLFERLGIEIDADDPARLVLFPEMDESRDPPEITDACWDILGKSPDSVMCATSRMVVRRKDAAAAVLVACTLLPYDARFEFGSSLKDAAKPVSLNHRHCATFCVLGGASCSPHRS